MLGSRARSSHSRFACDSEVQTVWRGIPDAGRRPARKRAHAGALRQINGAANDETTRDVFETRHAHNTRHSTASQHCNANNTYRLVGTLAGVIIMQMLRDIGRLLRQRCSECGACRHHSLELFALKLVMVFTSALGVRNISERARSMRCATHMTPRRGTVSWTYDTAPPEAMTVAERGLS